MFLEIISPEKKIYSGEVSRVRVPGSNGLFEILNNHAPLISTLASGTIRIQDENGRKFSYPVAGGVVETRDNQIIILLDAF